MERLVWETAEELDQKLAQRVRNIRKRRSISQEKSGSYEWSQPRINKKI